MSWSVLESSGPTGASSDTGRSLTRSRCLDLVQGLSHRLGDLRGGGGAAELLGERVLLLGVLPQEQLDVHGQANGPRLVGEGARHRLANPPHGIRREARPPPWLEFPHGVQEAQVAFLDEVEEGEAAVKIAPGHAHDQAQVRLGQPALGGSIACLDTPGKLLLLVGREERNLGDVTKVEGEKLAAPGGSLGLFLCPASSAGSRVRKRLEGLTRVVEVYEIGARSATAWLIHCLCRPPRAPGPIRRAGRARRRPQLDDLPGRQELQRVVGQALVANLEVEMRRARAAAAPDGGDDGAGGDPLPHPTKFSRLCAYTVTIPPWCWMRMMRP